MLSFVYCDISSGAHGDNFTSFGTKALAPNLKSLSRGNEFFLCQVGCLWGPLGCRRRQWNTIWALTQLISYILIIWSCGTARFTSIIRVLVYFVLCYDAMIIYYLYFVIYILYILLSICMTFLFYFINFTNLLFTALYYFIY